MPTSVHNRNHVHGNKTDGVPFPRQYFTDQKKTYVQKCSELCGFFSKLFSWTRWSKKHCRKTPYCIPRNKPCTNRKWFTEEARLKNIETSIGTTESQEKLPTKNYKIFPKGSQHNFPEQTIAKKKTIPSRSFLNKLLHRQTFPNRSSQQKCPKQFLLKYIWFSCSKRCLFDLHLPTH